MSKGEYTELQVLKSGAGYYIGRLWEEEDGYAEPGTRESGYYLTHECAEQAMKDGFTLRVCDENILAYALGEIPTRPGTFYKED